MLGVAEGGPRIEKTKTGNPQVVHLCRKMMARVRCPAVCVYRM